MFKIIFQLRYSELNYFLKHRYIYPIHTTYIALMLKIVPILEMRKMYL